MINSQRTSFKYTIFGIFFGLLFPILGTLIYAYDHNITLVQAQQSGSKLLWIINSAPLFLGLFARFIGIRQEELELLEASKKNTNIVNKYLKINAYRQRKMTRIVFIATLSAMFTIASSIMYYVLDNNRYSLEKTVEEHLAGSLHILKQSLNDRLLALDRMANRHRSNTIAEQGRWQKDARNYYENFSGFKEIVWVDTSFVAQWTYPQNNANVTNSLDYTRFKSRSDLLSYTKQTKEGAIFSTSIDFKPRELTLASLHPTFFERSQDISGYIIAIYDTSLVFQPLNRDNFSLNLAMQGQSIHSHNGSYKTDHWISSQFNLRNVTLEVKLSSTTHFATSRIYSEKIVILIILLTLLSFLVAIYSAHLFLSKHRVTELYQKSKDAKETLDEIAIYAKTDNKGLITEVNQKFCEISGYTKEELIGRDHRIINSKHHPKSFFVELWSTIKAGNIWRGQIKNKAKDGRFYWVDTSIIPRYTKTGVLGSYTVIRTDITKEKEAEQDLLKAKDVAEKALAVKSQFLANMSHEIRTPMNGVTGLTKLLLDMTDDPAIIDKLKTIQSCSDSLITIINDILDYSKIEAGKLDIEHTPFNIKRCVEDIYKLLTPRAEHKGLSLKLECGSDITWIYGDPVRIRQILTNLVANAIKFTQAGEVRIKFSSTKGEQNGSHKIRFDIIDAGIGIPRDVMPKLFSAFTQADVSTTRKFGGTGLGLSICKGLVESMKGKIWATSIEGKGSTFSFEISFMEAPPQQEQEHKLSKTDQNFAQTYPLRILVAEDNSVNQVVIRGFLKRLGYEVNLVDNGKKAVQKAVEGQYDLVLMDCHMPEMDGFEATKAIKSKKPDYPKIIALTAGSMKEDRERCRLAGMDGFLSKPVSFSGLGKALSSLEHGEHMFDQKINSNKHYCILTSHIDRQQIDTVMGHDKDLMYMTLSKILNQCTKEFEAINACIEKGDFENAEIQTQALNGTISVVHAENIRKDLALLLHELKRKDKEEIMPIMTTVSRGIEELKLEIRDLLSIELSQFAS